MKVDQKTVEKRVDEAADRLTELLNRANKVADDLEVRERVGDLMNRANKVADDLEVKERVGEFMTRANKAARNFELGDRLSDALAALTRNRSTQRDESGIERFMTGLLVGIALGFGVALVLAPKSGEEMREDLMQKGIELRDRAGQLAQRQFGNGGSSSAARTASSEQSLT